MASSRSAWPSGDAKLHFVHTREQIADDLRCLGLESGDVVMVHVSLRRIGPVEGGADGLIDALQSVVGSEGTLLVNIGVRDDHAWVNDRPEHERVALLADAAPFDHRATPADPDNGAFAEAFRVRPTTITSDHPEGRFGASGRLAEELLDDAPWDDYYGAGSPLERLVQHDGRVLRLGADRDTVTLLHYAEASCAVPDKRRVRRHRLVSSPGGPVVRVVETLDDSDGIVEVEHDYFPTILDEYLATGNATVRAVGDAVSELIDAGDLVRFAIDWLDANL